MIDSTEHIKKLLHGGSEVREWTNLKWISDEKWKDSLSNQEKSFLTFSFTLCALRSVTCLVSRQRETPRHGPYHHSVRQQSSDIRQWQRVPVSLFMYR